MTPSTDEIGDTPSIDAVKVLQPLEDEPDTECQCCFGDDHMVSDLSRIPVWAEITVTDAIESGLHDTMPSWTLLLSGLPQTTLRDSSR